MIHLTKIIAAVLVLLALSLGIYAWMLSRQAAPAPAVTVSPSTAPAARLYPVVVTAKAVPAGQPLLAESLRVVQLPIKPDDAFNETSAAAGHVPVTDLGEGSPLLKSQMVSGLALRLEEGERAVAVKADEAMGVGYRLQPGDFVDVFLMLKADRQEIDRSQARLLLSRKRVLAFGTASVDGAPSRAESAKAGNQAARNEGARTVVLAVPVAEVNLLNMGDSSGRLVLALRNPADLSVPDPKLFAELPIILQPQPAAAGAKQALTGIEVAQGGLATADFVNGSRARSQATQASVTGGGVLRSHPGTAATRGGSAIEVEVIRGDRRETLRY
jgi:pilus assembly protein CpaB